MKKLIIPIGALLFSGLTQAQLSSTENYVYSKTYLDYNGATPTKTFETVQYFDGLGRPKQVVNIKASSLSKDVVTKITYDQFGRQTLDYLPIPQTGTQNGGIYTDPLANAPATPYGTEKIYAEKQLENSPLDRILSQKQVGNAWNDKPIQFGYDANIDGEVQKYTATFDYTTFTSSITKKVGGSSLGTGLQDINYTYNIRGWMTQINDPTNLGNDLFGYEIKFTNPEDTNQSSPKYNGNISEIDWRTASSFNNNKKRYSYQYDGLNRLLAGIYSEPGSSIIANNNYNEQLTYDLNGNILTLKRFSKPSSGTTAELIDDLEYKYIGNRLNKIQLPAGVVNNYSGYNAAQNDFGYDDNGNMKVHMDNGISSIDYNYLNLPNKILTSPQVFFNTYQLYYKYRSDGQKVEKTYITSQMDVVGNLELVELKTYYLDGFQYSQNVNFGSVSPLLLRFIPTSEGYYDFVKNKYIYNYTDHLGNIRLSYMKGVSALEIQEENNYYPFGLKHETTYLGLANGKYYNYQYNGKELQETGMYDYGARMYMPDLGRWGISDGKGELYLSKSPYSYANNTPVNAIDPDGNLVIFINGQHGGSGESPDYWRSSKPTGYMTANGGSPFAVYARFDQAIMRQLNDNNSLYKDGAMGGFKNTLSSDDFVPNNRFSYNRIEAGFTQGKKDAKDIIANLARDSSTGEIIETIKIITHSMGGAYGKGYVKALKEYISTLPKEQQKQIKITLVADFDPYQAGEFAADSNIDTRQFEHANYFNIWGLGTLANEDEQNLDKNHIYKNTGQSTDHSIQTFFNDISRLQEGSYKWNGKSWVCTTCH